MKTKKKYAKLKQLNDKPNIKNTKKQQNLTKLKIKQNNTNRFRLEVKDEPRCFDSHYMKCVIDFGYLNVEDPDGKTETCS